MPLTIRFSTGAASRNQKSLCCNPAHQNVQSGDSRDSVCSANPPPPRLPTDLVARLTPVVPPAMPATRPQHSPRRWLLTSIQVLASLLVLLAVAVWLVERPRQVIEEFAGHLSHERYPEAAQLLMAPGSLRVAENGDLIVVDCEGTVTTVPHSRLPFLVGGGRESGPGDFSMTALQGSTRGVLSDTPAVVLYLQVVDGRVRIVRVER